jgi:hypothetical protein
MLNTRCLYLFHRTPTEALVHDKLAISSVRREVKTKGRIMSNSTMIAGPALPHRFQTLEITMKRLILAAIRCSLMFTAVTGSLVCVQPAQAYTNYTVKLKQVGANVVATGSGSINLTGLTFLGPGQVSGGAMIGPNVPLIQTGPTGLVNFDHYGALFIGPTNFGSGGLFSANTGSGDFVGINVPLGLLFVPQGYVSGSALSDSMTFNNATFASLGVTTGIFHWQLETPESLIYTQYNLWCNVVPDGGSTVSFLGFALLGLAALRRKLSC